MAAKKSATKKSATKTRPTPGWSSEGGWAQVVPRARLTERPLLRLADEKLDLAAFGEPPPADPLEAIRALSARVDRVRAREIRVRQFDRVVARAWGQRVCDALGWIPVELRDPEGRMFIPSIVSPDRRFYIDLRPYRARVVDRRGSNNLELLFSMLRDGSQLPPVQPGAYLALG